MRSSISEPAPDNIAVASRHGTVWLSSELRVKAIDPPDAIVTSGVDERRTFGSGFGFIVLPIAATLPPEKLFFKMAISSGSVLASPVNVRESGGSGTTFGTNVVVVILPWQLVTGNCRIKFPPSVIEEMETGGTVTMV